MTDLPVSDIQGLIIRGYRSYDHVRHLVVAVTNAEAARAVVAELTAAPGSGLRITRAARWTTKPPYTLNAGFTYLGLQALGVDEAMLNGFSREFQSGAVGQAANIHDTGDSSPAYWDGGMGTPANVHAIFSVFAPTAQALDSSSAKLRTELASGFKETYSHDGAALPDGFVHFGYKDGISQPSLIGGPPPSHPYPAALAPNPAGDFLLGYTNSFGNLYSPEIAQQPIGKNGSYAAFRILKQDVAGFESYLQKAAERAGITPDLLAAKFLGRWRNGSPLVLAPGNPAPIPSSELNMFLYTGTAPGQKNPDPKGVACPVGAHIRRGNPRDDRVAGGDTRPARIMRRAMTYGPVFDAAKPNDGIERGLIGYFVNGDFNSQFELVMSEWMNTDGFTANGPITGRDAILGDNDPASSKFTVATSSTTSIAVTGFERFVITRGSAYVFLPGITGLQFIAGTAS